MNIIAFARRICPLPEIIRANKERKVKRIKVTRREWENETQGMSDGIYTLTVTWSPLITFIMWAFPNPVNDSLHWKVSKPDQISLSITGDRVLKGIYSCSRALCCHTGVPLANGICLALPWAFSKAPFTIFPAGDDFVRHQRKQETGKSPVITVIGG